MESNKLSQYDNNYVNFIDSQIKQLVFFRGKKRPGQQFLFHLSYYRQHILIKSTFLQAIIYIYLQVTSCTTVTFQISMLYNKPERLQIKHDTIIQRRGIFVKELKIVICTI